MTDTSICKILVLVPGKIRELLSITLEEVVTMFLGKIFENGVTILSTKAVATYTKTYGSYHIQATCRGFKLRKAVAQNCMLCHISKLLADF